MKVNYQPHTLAALYQLKRQLIGTQSWFGQFADEKIFCPCQNLMIHYKNLDSLLKDVPVLSSGITP
jgi:hypothetical protein